MSASVQEIERGAVMAGFDGSDNARRAVHWAAEEAKARNRPLLIVQSFEWGIPFLARGATTASEYGVDRIREYAEADLEGLVAECRRTYPDLTVTSLMPDGPPEETLPDLEARAEPELAVFGASGRGAVYRAVLGSSIAELARTLRCPMIVVRDGEDSEESAGPTGAAASSGPVVVGVDGSATSDRAVEFALGFAARRGVPVRAVHAWSDWPLDILASAPLGQVGNERAGDITDDLAKNHVESRRDRYPDVPVEWESVADRPADALLRLAKDAGLLVVGSHGRGPARRVLLGSVSHAVLYHAPCPVALLRDLDEGSAHGSEVSNDVRKDEGGSP
ncbi:universal stress protein [Qaidamihabitans albus]|uniref:universal stress protein n=1 Tax=Qaidamihabitans albus TaxID=2795733 RepID=UPI001F29B980|nr:universal stress protein [Qaidamihabitans albus]